MFFIKELDMFDMLELVPCSLNREGLSRRIRQVVLVFIIYKPKLKKVLLVD